MRAGLLSLMLIAGCGSGTSVDGSAVVKDMAMAPDLSVVAAPDMATSGDLATAVKTWPRAAT